MGVIAGRVDERQLLRAAVSSVADRSSAMLVVGEAGIGKTRLVEDAAAAAADAGVRVLRGACSPLSGDVPYAPLQVLLSGAARGGLSTSTAVPGSKSQWYAVLDRALVDGTQEDATMVLVEDLHWADVSTLGYLAHLSRNLPATGLVLVMSYRDDGDDELHDAWLGEQLRCPTVVAVPLGGLTRAEMAELAGTLRPEVTPVEVDRLHSRSGGNPYLATELALVAEDDAAVPRTLRQVLGSALRRAGPAAVGATAAVHAVGRAVTDDELVAVAGDADAARAARDSRLIEPAPGDERRRWRARHPVLAELAYDGLLPPERRSLHGRLALVAEATLPTDPPASFLAELARHHLEAGHDDDTLVWSVRAAQAAELECAFAEAGRWYAAAVDVWPSASTALALVPSRSELVEAAGRNLAVAGRHREVLELVDPYLDPSLEPQGASAGGGAGLAALLVHRSWCRFVEGDTEGARADIDRAVAAVDASTNARVAADVLAQKGMIEITCSNVATATAAATQALQLARASGNRGADGRATAILGTTDLMAGRTGRGLSRVDEGLRTAAEEGDADGFALSAVVLVSHHADNSSPSLAVEVADSLRAQLRVLAPDGHWLDEMITANQVAALAAAGLWDRARETVSGTTPVLGFADITVALIDARSGRTEDARAALSRWGTLDRRDQPQFHMMVAAVSAELAMVEGRLTDVVTEALDALGLVVATPVLCPDALPVLLAGLRAAARLGDAQARDRIATELPADATGRLSGAVQAQIDAELAGPEAAGDRWEAAVDAWASLGRPYEEAVARLSAGEAHLAVRGRRRRAADALSAARELADLMGCPPLLDAVAQLARAARLPVDDSPAPGVTADAPAELTAREVQVLELVARGRTNRQIGEHLYMSPKTASVHVTRILQKLGVSTRVQAATLAVQRGLVPRPAEDQADEVRTTSRPR